MQIEITGDTSVVPIFSDVNAHVNKTSVEELVYDESSIQNSIVRILSTKKGSRVFRRDFGAALHDLVFQPMDDITVNMIRTELRNAIGTWEPRVTLKSAVVKPDYENQMYYVSLSYIIPRLNNKQANFVFNILSGA